MKFLKLDGEEIRTYDMFTIINIFKELKFFKYTTKINIIVYIFIDNIQKNIMKYSHYNIDTGIIYSGYIAWVKNFINDNKEGVFEEMSPDMLAKVLLLK